MYDIRPDEKELDKPVKNRNTFVRILAIILLGIFGSATLISGVFLTIQEKYVIGVPAVIIGATFVIAFILYENYR
jgi:hypothetical protein